MKVLDSTVPCPRCGDPMKCVLTGPEPEPDTRATYVCRHADWEGNCAAAALSDTSKGAALVDAAPYDEQQAASAAPIAPRQPAVPDTRKEPS